LILVGDLAQCADAMAILLGEVGLWLDYFVEAYTLTLNDFELEWQK